MGVGFRWVVPDTHDYFLPRPKAGQLSLKSGADMIISCGDLRLISSARHRKVSHSRGLDPAARWGGVPKVAPEPSPYIYGVARGLVGGPAARWGDVPKSCTGTSTLGGWLVVLGFTAL